jgi:tRNA A-37 threonylcarbamoyl transferase component Bud32
MNHEIAKVLEFAIPIDHKDQGAQGVVFQCLWKDMPAIMKKSNNIDFVLDLEEEVWDRLKKLECVHFCEVLSKFQIKPNENLHCLIFEQITNNSSMDSLANIIYKQVHHPNALLNCVRQTLAAIAMFESLGITHYDLHADNVMVTDTLYDIHVYKIGDKIIPIQTYGIAPVIIDFGLAYVPNSNWKASCMFAGDGFTTFMPDPLIDSRLLLMSALNISGLKEVVEFPSSPRRYKSAYQTIQRFIDQTELIFKPLNLQKNGWFNDKGLFPDVMLELLGKLPQSLKDAKKGIFKQSNFGWIIELLQFGITIPVTEMKPDVPRFEVIVCDFAIQWKKFIEPVIRNTHEEKLFFKDIISTDDEMKIKEKYPTIKNISRLKKCIRTLSDAFSNYIFERGSVATQLKKSFYDNVKYKTTIEILCALPSMHNKYTNVSNILIMDPLVPMQTEIIVDKKTASQLNKNEQGVLKTMLKNYGDELKICLSNENNEET